jgi:hypothetical protein
LFLQGFVDAILSSLFLSFAMNYAKDSEFSMFISRELL